MRISRFVSETDGVVLAISEISSTLEGAAANNIEAKFAILQGERLCLSIGIVGILLGTPCGWEGMSEE